MTDLAKLSLTESSALLQARRASARELVDACLAGIATAGPTINAFLAVDAVGARRAALESDGRRVRGTARGPLDGIPLAHKDIFERSGRRLTCGSAIFDTVPARTATVLARLDAAGAIDLGPLHLAEFAAGATGHNRHHGACRNPWNRERIPGGSSSGSAAAVAARLIFGSLGTDTGGSLRLPAHFCGVAALRPTPGRVSAAGVFPRVWSMDAVGPMARSAADLALIFAVLAEDGVARTREAPSSRSGLRIGIPDRFFFDRVEPAIGDLIETARKAFARFGAESVPVEIPDPAPLFSHALDLAQAEAAAIHRRWIAERRADYDHGTVDGIEPGFAAAAHAYAESLAARAPARRAWLDGVFARCDLLLTPVFEHPTPRLDDCDPARPGAMREFLERFGRCTRPFSYLGLPALALPCGFQPDGMPAALQLIARPGAEAVLLAAGEAYQRETDWHGRAPPPARAVTAK